MQIDSPYVSIPIDRKPNFEIQMDILALNQYFRDVNYNVRYLVVIVETYTRFVWSFPTTNLTVEKVKNAIFLAFSRPGLSEQYFKFLQPQLRKITIDGGSEFKKDFPDSMKDIFNPYVDVIVSPPKNVTFNRPTITGPIEAAIAEMRKLLRDYSLEISPNILRDEQQGLTRALNQYNFLSRTHILEHNTPADVVLYQMRHQHNVIDLTKEDEANEKEEKQSGYIIKQTRIPQLDIHVKKEEEHAEEKKQELQDSYPIIRSENENYAYRLFLPQGAFPKQVDIRVSPEAYFIKQVMDGRYVLLQEIGKPDNTKKTTWKSLVLVKAPIEEGPHQLLKNIKQEEQNEDHVTNKNVVQPYAVSSSILHTLGEDHNFNVGNEPTRRSERSRAAPKRLINEV